MRALLVYPKFRDSYWSFEKALELIGKRAMMPPLGLITVAAILPQDWEFRLRDRNIETVSDEDWAWADLVLLSGMLVQKDDMHAAIAEAHRHGKPTVCGGPYATALPQELEQAGADFLVLDEGEITIPLWLEDLGRGAKRGVYTASGEKPDVTQTPIPRFDLLDLTAYSEMAIQYSRGCPFRCEFCDIIVLYGDARAPRRRSRSWPSWSGCTNSAGGAASSSSTTTSSATRPTPSRCCARCAPGRNGTASRSTSPPRHQWTWPRTRN
jgi:radical SAM superfamily enzyme YgiQ (UPF0313 family)